MMKRLINIASVLLLTAPLLAACASTQGQQTDAADTGAPNPAPEFTGPWAEEFRFRYGLAPDDEVREMLADEQVSDAEKQVVTDRFRNCLAGHNIAFDDFKPGGGYDFSFPDSIDNETANRLADDCSRSEGVDAVIHLYFVTRNNPNNEDLSEEIAACLVRGGLVPSGFTGEDYKKPDWAETWKVDETQQYSIESRCQQDPKHAFAQT